MQSTSSLETLHPPQTKPLEELDSAVIRFCGDSGDGMQLVGTQFTNVSAAFGNDVSTLPDFPAEIRAPAGTLPGVSGFQLHFSSQDIFTPGDLVDTHANAGFDLVCVTWGSRGATLHRNGMAAGSQKGLDALSSDPAVAALHLGGPGSGGASPCQNLLPEAASRKLQNEFFFAGNRTDKMGQQ